MFILVPWILRGYKIQQQHTNNYREVKNAFVLLFWNHVMWIFPMAFVQLIWEPPTPLPPLAPRLWPFLWQQVVVFFLFDAYYWAWHALHHKVKLMLMEEHSESLVAYSRHCLNCVKYICSILCIVTIIIRFDSCIV